MSVNGFVSRTLHGLRKAAAYLAVLQMSVGRWAAAFGQSLKAS
jgi:hypothetical protein